MSDVGAPDYPPNDEGYLRSIEADLAIHRGRPSEQEIAWQAGVGGGEILPFPGTALEHASDASQGLITAPELMSRPLKPRPWLVRDVIPAKQVCELRGDGGTGKSTLALQLCASAVTGRSWLNMPVTPGAAIYLASEDDEDELHRRLDAVATHLQLPSEAMGHLHIWPLASEDPALVGRDEDTKGFGPTARWEQLAKFVRKIKPVVVVLDSRADVFGGDEINRGQVKAFVAQLRKLAVATGAAIVILAHPSNTGLANRSGNSGSTHWTNAVRAALNFEKMEDPEHGGPSDLRKLTVVKNNYAAGSVPMIVRWSAGVFVAADEGAPVNRTREQEAARIEQMFLDLLERRQMQGRKASPSHGRNFAPAVFAADPDAKKAGVDKKGFEMAMERLLKAGRIRVRQVGQPSRLAQELYVVEDLAT